MDTVAVELTQGEVAIVDSCDIQLVAPHRWVASKHHGRVYARATIDGRNISMHRLILGVSDSSILVDHKDRDGLNNTRENLRIATPLQNSRNRSKNQGRRYKGVLRKGQLWSARIYVNGKPITIGKYETEEEAAAAYDLAATRLYGEFASPNGGMECRQKGTSPSKRSQTSTKSLQEPFTGGSNQSNSGLSRGIDPSVFGRRTSMPTMLDGKTGQKTFSLPDFPGRRWIAFDPEEGGSRYENS